MHDFPRDHNSSYNLIESDAIRKAILELADGLEHVEGVRSNRSFVAMEAEQGGWHVVEALKIGAICAFMKGLGTEDYSAALVRQALSDYGWEPESKAEFTV